MSLDGVDEYFNGASTFSELDGGTKLSLSIWIKPISGSPLLEYVLSNPRDTTANNSQFALVLYEGNIISFNVQSRTSQTVNGRIGAITYGAWNHILVCVDLDRTIGTEGVIFVNGVDETTSSNMGTLTQFYNASDVLYVGEEANGGFNPFNGSIDELAIWVNSDQRANASDIYNGGVPFDLSTLATAPDHWWRMGDGDSFGGGVWTLNDNIGSYNLDSVNMEDGDRVTDVPGVVDADAQAFITAASITDSTEQSAINQLVVDLKGYSIWTKMKAIYPFVGGTASTHKYNLKDSQDTDAAFRLVFNGGWTHSSNGALPNGTNGWAETFVKTGTDLALNSTHVSVYLRTDTAAADRLAIGNCFGGANFELSLWIKGVGNYNYHRNNTNVSSITSNSDSRGLFIGNRNSSTQQKIVKNTTINTFSVNSVSTTNTRTINISSALNAYNTARAFYDNKELAFSSIGDGLTDTDLANFYTAVQAFQTTLSRNV
jgi:hypothetical protein